MTKTAVAGAVVLAVGMLLNLVGAVLFKNKRNIMARALKVNGRVVNLKKSDATVFVDTPSDNDFLSREEENIFKGETLAPVIEFETAEGKRVTVEGVGSSKPSFKLGDTVPLFYLPERPEKAIVDSFLDKWMPVAILSGIGGVLCVSGLLLLFLA